jgi:hypothetical protein
MQLVGGQSMFGLDNTFRPYHKTIKFVPITYIVM